MMRGVSEGVPWLPSWFCPLGWPRGPLSQMGACAHGTATICMAAQGRAQATPWRMDVCRLRGPGGATHACRLACRHKPYAGRRRGSPLCAVAPLGRPRRAACPQGVAMVGLGEAQSGSVRGCEGLEGSCLEGQLSHNVLQVSHVLPFAPPESTHFQLPPPSRNKLKNQFRILEIDTKSQKI